MLKHICDHVRSGIEMSSRSQLTIPAAEVRGLASIVGLIEARPREMIRRNFILTSEPIDESLGSFRCRIKVVAFYRNIAIFTNCCTGLAIKDALYYIDTATILF